MIDYFPYSIFVSGDPLGPYVAKAQKETDPVKRHRMEVWLDSARKTSNSMYRPQPRAYEERVRVLLNAIGRAKIGIVLLTSLKRIIPVWIVPYQHDDRNAITGQMSSDITGGVRVQYSPDTWALGPDRCVRYYPGYGAVESLFHELVHASRFSNFGYAGMNHQPLENMKDHEEFLAVMLTNLLRSEWRAQKFERDYLTSKYGSQSEMEQFLSSKREYLNALEYFLSNDPFVKQVARMPMSFNPFRDLSRLKTTGASNRR